MRRAAKVDRNQGQIVEALRAAGASVEPIFRLGRGIPDLLVGYRWRNFLLEVKDGEAPPSKRRLTPDEQDWHDTWRGQACVVETVEEALRAIGVVKEARPDDYLERLRDADRLDFMRRELELE